MHFFIDAFAKELSLNPSASETILVAARDTPDSANVKANEYTPDIKENSPSASDPILLDIQTLNPSETVLINNYVSVSNAALQRNFFKRLIKSSKLKRLYIII